MEGTSRAASEVPAEPGVGNHTANTAEPFSFTWLEAFIAKSTPPDNEPMTTKLDRYAVAGVLLFGLLAVLGALLLRNQLGQRILQIGVVLQWLCVGVTLVNAGWRALRAYQCQHEAFAQDLDRQRGQYNTVVDAISRYPDATICNHLRYIRDLKTRLVYRGGLISGGFDKLGVLPLLLAMYFQFKDWTFGGWRALFDHVHLLGTFLLSMVVITYFLSWWVARAKDRLDLYEMLLTEASIRASGGEEAERGFSER
jgi:hypothetical protein